MLHACYWVKGEVGSRQLKTKAIRNHSLPRKKQCVAFTANFPSYKENSMGFKLSLFLSKAAHNSA